MKKRKSNHLALILCSLFFSCSGSFTESADDYILLKSPIGTCEGKNDPSDSERIIADFTWENSGSFENGILYVFNASSNDPIVKQEIEAGSEMVEISLERGIEFEWYIKSKRVESNDSIPSDKKQFISEFITQDLTPFPVVIEDLRELADSFIVEWANHPDETNTDLSYMVYFSSRIEKDEQIAYQKLEFLEQGIPYSSGDVLSREQQKTGLKAGDYFFKIDAIALSGNNELISSSYKRVPLANDY